MAVRAVRALGEKLRRTGLTRRSYGFLLAGSALLGTGMYLAWPPLAQLGLFLFMLPLASLAAVALRRDEVEARRVLGTELPELGEPIPVVLQVTPRGGGLGPIVVSDEAPPHLGGTHVAAISGTARQHTSRHRYLLVASRRGPHELGPARMFLTDRLGLVARSRRIAETTPIMVVPLVHHLGEGIPTGATSGPGWGSTGAPGGSHDDVIPRDYRPGDELRRMDWRATARTGSLMVRGEEQPWRASLLIALDRRERSHRGPAGSDSLEAALSLVASVATMALMQGWDLRVVDLAAHPIFDSAPQLPPEHNCDRLARALAVLQVTATQHPSPALAAQVPEGGPALLVLGENAAGTVQLVADLLGTAHPALAAVLAAPTWEKDSGPLAIGANAREAHDLLVAEGWLVTTMTRATPIPQVWARLEEAAATRGGITFAGQPAGPQRAGSPR